METKVCTKCKVRKGLDEFDPAASGKPQSWCRDCKRADCRERSRIYTKKKSEALRKRKEAWDKYGDVLETRRQKAYTELCRSKEAMSVGYMCLGIFR